MENQDLTNNNSDNLENKGKEVVENLEESINDISEKAKEVIHAENKKVLCGILALVLGSFGVHKFVLGYTKEGVLQILLTFLCGIGSIIAIVEGIIYLTKSDEDFYTVYQANKKGWF